MKREKTTNPKTVSFSPFSLVFLSKNNSVLCQRLHCGPEFFLIFLFNNNRTINHSSCASLIQQKDNLLHEKFYDYDSHVFHQNVLETCLSSKDDFS